MRDTVVHGSTAVGVDMTVLAPSLLLYRRPGGTGQSELLITRIDTLRFCAGGRGSRRQGLCCAGGTVLYYLVLCWGGDIVIVIVAGRACFCSGDRVCDIGSGKAK